jgi:hypothetical protein
VTSYNHRELGAPIRLHKGVRDSKRIVAVLGDHADDIGTRFDVSPQLRTIETVEVLDVLDLVEESIVAVAGGRVEEDLAI